MILRISLTAIINVLFLLLLIVFIYSILGAFLFNNIKNGKIIGEYTNFNGFGMAMFVLIRVTTGENWNTIMHDVA